MTAMTAFVLHTLFVLLAGVPAVSDPAGNVPPAPGSEHQLQIALASSATLESAVQENGGVRFYNSSRETQFVLATFDGEQCGEMNDRGQLELAPGETGTVDSGSSRVCWCASSVGKVGDCTSWSKAKPGKRVTLR